MVDLISVSLSVLQIVVQAVAAYYSYRIYYFNRLNKGWLAVSFALVIMTLRRVTALIIEFNLMSNLTGWISYMDRIILPTIISICLFVGLYSMFKNFEDFDVVQKKVKNIVRRANDKNKK